MTVCDWEKRVLFRRMLVRGMVSPRGDTLKLRLFSILGATYKSHKSANETGDIRGHPK